RKAGADAPGADIGRKHIALGRDVAELQSEQAEARRCDQGNGDAFGCPGKPIAATIGTASRNRIGTGMNPYLSSGRMMVSPPNVPANWNAVIASAASSRVRMPLVVSSVGTHWFTK